MNIVLANFFTFHSSKLVGECEQKMLEGSSKSSVDLLRVDLHCSACYPRSKPYAHKPTQMYHCIWITDLPSKEVQGDWDMFYLGCHRSKLSPFIDTAANILGPSTSFWFFFFCYSVWGCWLTRTTYSMLWMSVSAAVSKESQQHLTCGCQLKEDTNYLACIWKLRCCMWPCVHSVAWWIDDSVCPFLTVASRVSGEL